MLLRVKVITSLASAGPRAWGESVLQCSGVGEGRGVLAWGAKAVAEGGRPRNATKDLLQATLSRSSSSWGEGQVPKQWASGGSWGKGHPPLQMGHSKVMSEIRGNSSPCALGTVADSRGHHRDRRTLPCGNSQGSQETRQPPRSGPDMHVERPKGARDDG